MKFIVPSFLLLLFSCSLVNGGPSNEEFFPWEEIEGFETKVQDLVGPKIHEYVSSFLP